MRERAGYHIYMEEWEAAIGEDLLCEREREDLLTQLSASCTTWFAWAIACDSRQEERGPLDSGSPSLGCRYRRRAITDTCEELVNDSTCECQ